MSKITVKELEALSPGDGGRTLREDGGIVGRVRAGKRGVSVLFRYEFKLGIDKKDHSLGSWPKKSLAEIRAERDRMRVSVADGIDPAAARTAKRIERQKAVETTLAEAERQRSQSLTVQDLFDEWIRNGVARRDGNKELRRQFEKDVLPVLGHIELRKLTNSDIHAMESKLISRGVVRTAIMTFDNFGQMLRWGDERQPWRRLLIDGNPVNLVDMGKLIPDHYEEERERRLSPDEIRQLAHILSRTRAHYAETPAGTRHRLPHPLKRETELALWICLSTLCRIGELLVAKRQHVNLQDGTWYIPRSNVKGQRQHRREYFVFLSDFARQKFTELLELSGDSEWLFPARNKAKGDTHVCKKSVSKQVGDRQTRFQNRSKPLAKRRNDDSLVLSDGGNGNWTPHDLRRTGATMMQELGISLDIIDRCQNHIVAGPKVRRHYLLYEYAAEKTAAWKKLGDRLAAVLSDTNASLAPDAEPPHSPGPRISAINSGRKVARLPSHSELL